MSKFTYTVQPADDGYSVRDLIRRNFSFSSRLMTKLKQNDCICLNDEPVRVHIIPNPGDTVSISLPEEQSDFTPENIPIFPVFEDNDLLVINKSAGYIVHPTKGHYAHTIANGLAHYIIETKQSFKIRFINRLDMDTSGLLLIAKNGHCQDAIVKQMTYNKVTKKYIAVVKGILKDDSGTINLPIGRIEDRIEREVTPDGHPSVTHYTVLERFEKGFSLVELRLETGRTHQIRVHLSHIGHPIIGDHLYGGENVLLIERQALHAHFVSFEHPITGNLIELSAELPADMLKLIEKIRT
ncbi:MAG: RluA family pseudouridine synthase [Clostridiales bacterium]|nr:RluA family pseudouridine synthase [Clostridiales bacterium]